MRHKRFLLAGIAVAASTVVSMSVYGVMTAPPTIVHVPVQVAGSQPVAPVPVPEKVYIKPDTSDVLVVTRALEPGDRLAPSDIRWQAVLSDGVPQDAYVRQSAPDAEQKLIGSTVRLALGRGDFLTPARVVRTDTNFLAATLPPGMRAVAISLDPRGGRSAGGFIYPGDRVDVLVSALDPKKSQQVAKTLITGIKVLAMGQQVGDGAGVKSTPADTATLEVTPAEAELLAAATQNGGATITLALRPMSEPVMKSNSNPHTDPKGPITIVRFGVISENQ